MRKPGRPIGSTKGTKLQPKDRRKLQFGLYPEDQQYLTELQEETGESRSEIVREAIYTYWQRVFGAII